MGDIVTLKYRADSQESAERTRWLDAESAARLDYIKGRIAAIDAYIDAWNLAQLKALERIAIMDARMESLTLKEVAERFGVHYRTVGKLAQSAKLPAFVVGGQWRVTKAALMEWIEQQSRGKKPKKKETTL